MDQQQRAGVITAIYLIAITTSVVLYFRATDNGRRRWMAIDPGQRFLIYVCLLGWVAWVASTKVLRPWAAALGLEGHWTIAVAPSFIAGVPVTAFAALVLAHAHRLKALSAFLWGAASMLLLEVIQPLLPKYVFDPFDMLAGVCGAALMAVFLSRRARSSHGNVVAHDEDH
jgi:glycopeptide antibiotics resistance protein